MDWKLLAIAGISFGVAFGATRVLIPILTGNGLLDIPNQRSSHATPVPRGGGIGIICAIACGSLVLFASGVWIFSGGLLVGAAIIAAVGFLDDMTGRVPVLVRLGCQAIAAAIVVGAAGPLSVLPLPEPLDLGLGVFSAPVTLIWIIGVTNIYNFLDGIDGFAGLQGVIAGTGLFVLAGPTPAGALGLAIAGACGGFLVHNWHPARIFMGDAGSCTLGFLIAAAPLQLVDDRRGKAVFAIGLCLWFFLSDGVFTIIRRLLNREKIWAAHRSHLYQRLVISGLRHDQVAFRALGVGAVLAAAAVLSIRAGYPTSSWLALAFAVVCFIVYWRWTAMRERPSIKPQHRYGGAASTET
jgi:UDP-N-acetylmuramyl pentapeptide phosphotransferase/UDP-N-acetylglucosamine-1-phosphate transferase